MKGVSFNAADLMEEAVQLSGLENFGNAPMTEGLTILCHALEEEAELSDKGRETAQAELTDILVQRLKVEEFYRQFEEIEAQCIEAPIMVVGLPRSGTSALSQLLAQDPQNRSILRWEGAEPTPPLGDRNKADDGRIAKAQAELDAKYAAAPEMMAMNPVTVNDPTESYCFLRYCFSSLHFAGVYNVPSYEAWALDCDMRPAYGYLLKVLKLLQWSRPSTRWNLKFPPDLFYLAEIAEVIPSARFVWTHRDPRRAIPSVASLLAARRKPLTKNVDKMALGRSEFTVRCKQVERGLAYRDSPGSLAIADVNNDHLIRDPVGCIQNLYTELGIDMTERFRDSLLKRLEARPKGRYGEHRYTGEEFGVSREEIQHAFAGYIERFGL